MGSCTRRHFLLSICVLQMLFVIERQVFDFLGYMWAPILVNFFQILFVIFGFFGAYQYRPRYLVAYTVWSLLWLGWNIFLICFYLNIGILDRDSDLLNLGTGSVSWFEENGYGCRPTYPTNITSEDPYRPVRPERVDGCLLEYHIVEVVQSGIHCALAVFGIFGAICLGQTFLDEDDSLSRTSKKSKHRQSLYSIDFSRPVDAIRGAHPNDAYDDDDLMMGAGGGGGGAPSSLSPKPMTPRRVKRRSVMQRGTSGGGTVGRQSTSSRRGHSSSSAGSGAIASGSGGGAGHHHHHHHHHHRSSVRNSRRKTTHQNPVTKLLNQQQQHLQQQQHRLHHHGDALAGLEDAAGTMTLTKTFPPFVHNKNPDLTESNLKSLNNDYMLGQLNNFGQPVGAAGEAVVPGNNLNTFGAHHHHAAVQPPLPPHRRQALVHTPTFLDGDTASSPIDPIYYNMNSSSPLLQQQTSWGVSTSSPQGMGAVPGSGIHAGLSNPVYQHSTTNLNHSPELNEEYYGTNGQNRPPSVRSSYSNFHGTRPLSSYLGGGGTGGVAQPGGITNRGYNVSPPGQHGGTTAGGGQVENVFANLTSGGGNTNHQQQYGGITGGSAGGTDPIAIPQLPHRRSVSRESIRAMQFLNSGPPAYNLNYHTPPDSETTM
ncbi:AT-rich interactive domain-containing protein 1B isoform X2 [Anopheles gambiae]|uniref:AT-rich interactive domain-containing protein 1B isoform X2 n=1 Tax=Anopheles gambiae TaxID=7165 RepID=UPI002AC98CF7|nr:AT-rich interactive domain-containing protein 1B isoform X2 [Anopheles gambiae]